MTMFKKIVSSVSMTSAWIALALAAVPRPAQAAAGLLTPSLVGGLNYVTTSGGTTGFTAGLRLGADVGPIAVDLSGMYLMRGFDTTGGTFHDSWFDLPLMLRFSLIPMLSIGGGFYEDIAISSSAGSVYGIRGSAQLSPAGLPFYLEANYDYNLGSGSAGSLNDFQALIGYKF